MHDANVSSMQLPAVAVTNNGSVNNNNNSKYRDDFESFAPGYRFNPVDIELIVYYLMRKIHDLEPPPNRIPEINIYLYNPKELTSKYKLVREKAWYFFSPREKKYPNGSRPKRSAGNGYWKPTGKEKPIKNADQIVGYRRSLDFLVGKHPNGQKTNWKMHEYKLHEQSIPSLKRARDGNKLDDWVLCKIYYKRGDNDNNYDESGDQETSNDSSAQTSQQSVNKITGNGSLENGSFINNFGSNTNGLLLDPLSNNGIQNSVKPVEPQANMLAFQVSEEKNNTGTHDLLQTPLMSSMDIHATFENGYSNCNTESNIILGSSHDPLAKADLSLGNLSELFLLGPENEEALAIEEKENFLKYLDNLGPISDIRDSSIPELGDLQGVADKKADQDSFLTLEDYRELHIKKDDQKDLK